MGRRGPAPKPTSIRLLDGDHPERINRNEPVPPATEATAPEWLSAAALEVWGDVAPSLIDRGVLTPWDTEALGCYCDAVVRHRAAAAELDSGGAVVTGHGRDVKSPWHQVWRDTGEVMLRIGARFGLTPSDRSQLRTPQPASDHLERLLS